MGDAKASEGRGGTYSASEIKKAVLAKSISHPMTLYPAGLGIIGLLGAALLTPALPFAVAGLVGLSMGAGSWATNYFGRREKLSSEHIKVLRGQMQARHAAKLKGLEGDLKQCGGIPGAGTFIEQGVMQFTMVQEKFATLQQLLSTKLESGELTYGRYLGMAEQVYLSVIDSLRNITNILNSIRSIDPNYIAKRLKYLDAAAEAHDEDADRQADAMELRTLTERQEMRKTQLQQVNLLLSRNEEAITAMARTAVSVSAMQTGGDYASMDMDSALSELTELAGRAARGVYNK